MVHEPKRGYDEIQGEKHRGKTHRHEDLSLLARNLAQKHGRRNNGKAIQVSATCRAKKGNHGEHEDDGLRCIDDNITKVGRFMNENKRHYGQRQTNACADYEREHAMRNEYEQMRQQNNKKGGRESIARGPCRVSVC